MKRLCIGFQVYLGANWLAGQTTVASALQALRALGAEAPECVLVLWPGMGPQEVEPLRPWVDRTVQVPYQAPAEQQSALPRQPIARWLGRGRWAAPPRNGRVSSPVVREQGVHCLFTTPLRARPEYGVPTLLWLPDLQHVHLPELFSSQERAERDAVYGEELSAAARVVVTAEAVRQDLAQFAPAQASKARVLRFVVPVPVEVYQQDPRAAAAAYHLPERFVWLPNQFWKHKNHRLVLEALRRLQARAVYPVVVCAGSPHDHRNPQHLSDLLRQVAQWNLREQFILLGVVPHTEVLALMRQALCVLNPSLFEGYGYSVAESKAVGKLALLSDLPAHREQDPPGAIYFDPLDAGDLADKLEMIWKTAAPGPDLGLETAARAALPEQQRAFGRAFLNLAREAADRQ
jgi:glycosyltransferase involved in cell wall biosynthesis